MIALLAIIFGLSILAIVILAVDALVISLEWAERASMGIMCLIAITGLCAAFLWAMNL